MQLLKIADECAATPPRSAFCIICEITVIYQSLLLATMHLDLRKSARVLRKHIAERVRDYPLYFNEGPGKDEASIKQITVGYQFDQSGWFAMVFDTRRQAAIDGQWNSFIEPNAVDLPEWHKAYCVLGTNRASLDLTLLDGTKKSLGDANEEEFALCIGMALRDVLIDAREKGSFEELPLASDCFLVVEEQGGYYGWSDREDTAKESDRDYLTQLEGNVFSKPVDGQIAHWIEVLERIASGKETDSEWSFLAPEHAIQHLFEHGDRAIIPALKFVRKWANKPEFDGDRPKRNLRELPMQAPTIHVLIRIQNVSGCASEVEPLLHDILRRSVQVNTDRKLWGIIPVWAARCLFHLFEGYPEPKLHGSTNELVNRDEFSRKRRRM